MNNPLSIVFGEKVAWRSHELIDREFPAWMFDGTDLGPIPVETQIRSTVAQHRAPLPKSNAFAAGMFNLKALGASGMQKWIELYSIEEFRQAVQPTVEVINGATRFLEPQLMMLAISLDRFGYYRSNDKRRRPMYENILHCLESADLNWSMIGRQIGVARMIASVNNDLKHPDRESYPDVDVLAGATQLSKIIARAQLFDLLDVSDDYRQRFLGGNDVQNAIDIFLSAGITVSDEGEIVRAESNDSNARP